ncbi:hypothetical protein KGM_211834 [Danaus plexippus plexippus]|uniref:Uncharacterized protein n=1 Tax=Danaus plexippus plexippus TaxID=278856 RepID=A0A212F732_DANPL|nr:hypothetical protein KGM_211834 [Danaus plexippus plexippus]
MQAGGGWFVPWTMGVQKFAVALPMGGVVPLVPPLLAALPPQPPPLRLIAPPLAHQSQSGRKVLNYGSDNICYLDSDQLSLNTIDQSV